MEVNYDDKILEIKQKFAEKCGTPVDDIFFVLFGRVIDQEYHTVRDIHIQAESTIHALFNRVKASTPQGHILSGFSEKGLYAKYNIPLESQYTFQQRMYVNPIKFKLSDKEIALFIHYICNSKKYEKFVIINKDEPLYKIGEKLYFYHPTMMNDRDYLQLKHDETMLDIYKTPDDYKETLKPETILNAKINTSP